MRERVVRASVSERVALDLTPAHAPVVRVAVAGRAHEAASRVVDGGTGVGSLGGLGGGPHTLAGAPELRRHAHACVRAS